MFISVVFVLSFISIVLAAHSHSVLLSQPHSTSLSLVTYPIVIKTTSEWYFIIDTFLIDNDVIVAFNVIAWSVTFLIVFVIMTSSSGCIIR